MSSRSGLHESLFLLGSFLVLTTAANFAKREFGVYLRNEHSCQSYDFFSDHVARPLPVVASVDDLARDLKDLLAYQPEPSLLHPESLNALRFEITKRLRDLHVNLREQKSDIHGVIATTIFATVGSHEGKKIILAAPYGADGAPQVTGAPIAGPGGGGIDMTGAAVLLEVLRDIRQIKLSYPLRIPVEFVFYPTKEFESLSLKRSQAEGSLKTSAILSEEDRASTSAVILLDSLGRMNAQIGSQSYPHRWLNEYYPSAGNFLAMVGGPADRELDCRIKQMFRKGTHLALFSFNLEEKLSGFSFSVARRIASLHVPALVLTDTGSYRLPTDLLRRNLAAAPEVFDAAINNQAKEAAEIVHGLVAFLLEASKELVL